MGLRDRIERGPFAADGYCAPHGARMPHYSATGTPCEPDSPTAQAAYRAAPVQSPFTQRAIAGDLPAKDLGR